MGIKKYLNPIVQVSIDNKSLYKKSYEKYYETENVPEEFILYEICILFRVRFQSIGYVLIDIKSSS